MAPVTVTVRGEGTLERRPELGVVTLRVSADAATVAEASSRVLATTATIQDQIQSLAAVDAAPAASASAADHSPAAAAVQEAMPSPAITHWHSGTLATSSRRRRSSSSAYDDDKEKREGALAYRASVRMSATFRDFDRLGAFTARLAAMPLVQVDDVQWRLTDETSQRLRAEAATQAYRDAHEQAGTYARAMGRGHAVPVEVVQDSGGGFAQYAACDIRYGLADDGGAGAAPRQLVHAPQDVSVRVDCRVTFHIE